MGDAAASSNAPPSSALPITVIGGYLGAGKTTLLNSLLAQAHGRRIGVVVNDFGELGIDAGRVATAADGATDVVNLPNGCVCCTLGDDLMRTLSDLAAIRPALDAIVVEASGVADPTATAAWGTVPPFTGGGVIVLVAADTFPRLVRDKYVGSDVRRQIAGADLVVMTKTDLADNETTARARGLVADSSTAPVIDVVSGAVDIDLVLGPGGIPDRPLVSALQPRERPGQDAATHDDRYVRWSLTDARSVGLRRLRGVLNTLPDGVLRLKGSASIDVDATSADRTALIDVVGRTVHIALRDTGVVADADADADAANGVRLEAIGVGEVLDVDDLDAAMARVWETSGPTD